VTKTLAARQLNLVLILGKKKNFFLPRAKTGPRTHPASFSVHREVSDSEVTNELGYTSATHKCLRCVK
jgi:hypothetical protein